MIEGLAPQAIIALCAMMTILALIVNMLLAPLKGKQKELQDGQVRFEAELKDLQKGQARLESKIDKIEMLLSAQIPKT